MVKICLAVKVVVSIMNKNEKISESKSHYQLIYIFSLLDRLASIKNLCVSRLGVITMLVEVFLDC